MCLAQGPQRSDAGKARTHGPSVESSTLPLSHLAPYIIAREVEESGSLGDTIYLYRPHFSLNNYKLKGDSNIQGKWIWNLSPF